MRLPTRIWISMRWSGERSVKFRSAARAPVENMNAPSEMARAQAGSFEATLMCSPGEVFFAASKCPRTPRQDSKKNSSRSRRRGLPFLEIDDELAEFAAFAV